MLSGIVLIALIATGGPGGDKSNRNVMLNAESASAPREINIGLPSDGGAFITIDGFAHAHGVPTGTHHWPGSNALMPVGTIGLMESVLWLGEYGLSVDSRTRFGGDSLSGAFTGTSSNNGLIRVDAALNGPLGKGWHFALGAYANYDPTSVNSPSRLFVDQKQVYQAALTKRWSSTESLSFLYRFSLCNDRDGVGYSVAPFIYNGDGSIGLLNGFRLGRDCYMPADESASWMDLVSGKMQSGDMAKIDDRRLHDFMVAYNRITESGWKLEASAHLCRLEPSKELTVSLTGIDNVNAGQGFSLQGGGAYAGLIQNRLAMLYDANTLDGDIRLRAEKSFERHHILAGLNAIAAKQFQAASSFQFAHTVEANPVRINRGGSSTWSFNTNATYYNALKTKLNLFVSDDWRPVDNLLLRTGIRLTPLYNDIYSAVRLDGETINTRVDGFNLADPSLAKLHRFQKGGLDYVLTEHVSWRIDRRLSAMAEGYYTMTEKATSYYRNATLPSLKAIGNGLLRGGLTFEDDAIDITAIVSYITSWNNAAAVSVTKQIGGVSETQLYTAQYGIGTLGFTLDGNWHSGGFNLHARATWQDPKYKNYGNEFTFSDGSKAVLDYTGNTVTGISKLMIEFDPSYKWDNVRIWGSVRYDSRQYVSRTNLAWFSGHFETFAGADWDITSSHRLSLNLVNLFMQSGAKGSIDIADTIEDPSALTGYIMAGSYIRPFTVDVAYSYRF
ncbi:MAG: TonB-dependent receptor [Bacteroidales bacterium]|nr:TonB-dependent receptor [Bacteroidales bacterium]